MVLRKPFRKLSIIYLTYKILIYSNLSVFLVRNYFKFYKVLDINISNVIATTVSFSYLKQG